MKSPSAAKDPARRPVARIFTPAPLDPAFPNGFSGRWFSFARALEEHFDLQVVAIRGIWHGRHLAPDVFKPKLHLERFQLLDAAALPRWLRFFPMFSIDRLIEELSTGRAGPRVPAIAAALEPPPDLAVFFAHHMIHHARAFPATTRCVFVLEEGLVRTVHTNLPPPTSLAWLRNSWRRNLQRLAERRYRACLRHSDGRGTVVAINDDEARWLSRLMPKTPISVIAHGVDADLYSPRSGVPDHDVAVFGDLSQARNFVPTEHLIRKARERKETAHLRWLLVGRDPAAALRALASSTVTLTGTVDDIRDFYPRAKVVLVPARMVTGSKTTVLQAWGMGRPVITTVAGASGLPARSGVNLVIADTDDAILRAIVELIHDPQQADRIARAGRKTLEEERNLSRQSAEFASLCSTLVVGRSVQT
jgi:glycosyltransferase involved in cell wall biosynthesis